MSLPWDPTAKPPSDPAREEAVEEVKEAISDAAETVAEAVTNAAPTIVAAGVTGGDYTVTTTTMSGQQIKLADAKSRAYRTLFQNLGVDILVALATVLPMAVNFNFADPVAWSIFGASMAKTVINVFVSYVSRLQVTPTIQTPVETPSGLLIQPVPIPHAQS